MKDKLLKISRLVAEWAAQGGADTLERDLALELLREVYAEIKFGSPGNASVTSPDNSPVSTQGGSPVGSPLSAATDLATEPKPEFRPTSTPTSTPTPVPPATQQLSPEPPPLSTQPTTHPNSHSAPDFQSVALPRPVAPEIIRSLYGEGSSPTTLGDTLGAGRQTLADLLSEDRDNRDDHDSESF